MPAPENERARLAARSAELRTRVDELLTDFTERTNQLHEAQRQAAALTATMAAPGDRVRVSVDATGMLTDLRLAAGAFEETSPEALARTIVDLVRRATIQVRGQAAELLRPLTENLPDLSDLSEGAPSLADMLPKIPEYPASETAAPARPATEDEPSTWLR